MDVPAKKESFFKDEERVKKSSLSVVDYAIGKGMVMRTKAKPESSEVIQHAPFTIFPSPVPKRLFDQAHAVQQDFNFLMHTISHDFEFVKSAYSSVLETDDFTKNLFKIYETVNGEKPKKTELGIIRSDYMFHTPEESTQSLKQIEVNMISSSFGGIGSDKIVDIHKFSLRRAGLGDVAVQLPENPARTNIAQGLYDAWDHYGKENAGIAFIITERESNIFDQRMLEFRIDEINPNIKILRYTLTDVANLGKLDVDGNLLIQDNEIAVVYFRAGYSPDHYPSQAEWDARLMLDRSNAINCPSVAHQIVGAKKMQEVLAQPRVVERFIKDSNAVKRLRDTFAGFDGLEMGPEGDAAIEKALQNPDGYVLKPQLEGGGNNLYNDDLVVKLNEVKNDIRRCSYILMEKIHPMPVSTVILRAGSGPDQYKPVTGVSELGIFGILLANRDTILQNKTVAHLLRTKASHFSDGGVAAGVAVIDSPLLVD